MSTTPRGRVRETLHGVSQTSWRPRYGGVISEPWAVRQNLICRLVAVCQRMGERQNGKEVAKHRKQRGREQSGQEEMKKKTFLL